MTVISNQAPAIFEYLLDNLLMERNKLELDTVDGGKTRLKWKVLSRRKSALFKVSIIFSFTIQSSLQICFNELFFNTYQIYFQVHNWLALPVLLFKLAERSILYSAITNAQVETANDAKVQVTD